MQKPHRRLPVADAALSAGHTEPHRRARATTAQSESIRKPAALGSPGPKRHRIARREPDRGSGGHFQPGRFWGFGRSGYCGACGLRLGSDRPAISPFLGAPDPRLRAAWRRGVGEREREHTVKELQQQSGTEPEEGDGGLISTSSPRNPSRPIG